jgi:predicted dehydrogenase
VPQIIAAAQAGKHVLVEKPLSLSVASGRQALQTCCQAGVVLAVGHNRRFTSPLRAIKALVDRNALGTVVHAEANFSYPGGLSFATGYWRADPAEAPGGAMTATLIHMIDAFMHLLGPIERVIGARSKHRAAPIGIEDTTSFLVEFASGPTGYIGGSIAAPDASMLNLYGSAANIYAGIDEEQVTFHRNEGPREPLTIEPPVDSLRLELEAFARACTTGPAFPVAPEEALRNIAVMEAAIEAARHSNGVAVEPI